MNQALPSSAISISEPKTLTAKFERIFQKSAGPAYIRRPIPSIEDGLRILEKLKNGILHSGYLERHKDKYLQINMDGDPFLFYECQTNGTVPIWRVCLYKKMVSNHKEYVTVRLSLLHDQNQVANHELETVHIRGNLPPFHYTAKNMGGLCVYLKPLM